MPDETEAKPKGAPAETHNYRLATDPDGDHGYEVGFWPSGADMNDPAAFRVVAKCYSQGEAAQLAAQFDAAPPPDHLPSDESGEGGTKAEDDDDNHHIKHKRATSHRK
jgi:hypothetical protein